MKTYMHWHGGSSYTWGELDTSVEEFDSMADAIEQFRYRYESQDSYYPCVDKGTCAYLYFTDPRKLSDPYPDKLLTIGPRGGVVVERA